MSEDNIVFHDRNWSPDRVIEEIKRRKPTKLVGIFEDEEGSISSVVSDMPMGDLLMLRAVLDARIQVFVINMATAPETDADDVT